MDEITLSGRDRELTTSTLMRERPIRGESHVDFIGESEGSLPPPHDSFPDAGEAMDDFWSMSGNFMYRHHVEPRVKQDSRNWNRRLDRLCRTFHHHNLDVMQELPHRRLLEHRWVKRYVWISDRFHSVYFIGREASRPDICGPGRDWPRKQLTSRPDHSWPELWIQMGRNAQVKERQSGHMQNQTR